MTHRLVEVPGPRLARWVAGFEDRHGPTAVQVDPSAVHLTGTDGARARLDVPFGPAQPPDGVEPLRWLTARTTLTADALVLLLRRGGTALAVSRGGALVRHRSTRRYVQSRTAAGGWSQQRFARRRDGQTAAVVKAAAQDAVDLLAPHATTGTALVVGGDRALIEEVLGDRRLAAVAALPRSALLDVADPRHKTLSEALRRAACVRIHLDEP